MTPTLTQEVQALAEANDGLYDDMTITELQNSIAILSWKTFTTDKAMYREVVINRPDFFMLAELLCNRWGWLINKAESEDGKLLVLFSKDVGPLEQFELLHRVLMNGRMFLK